MRTFRYQRLLQWSECDPAGIIFFPNYARWMVEGVNLMFLALGIDPNGKTDDGLSRGLPSTGFTISFKAPAVLHDHLVHEITVSKIGGKSMSFTHRILRDGVSLAEAEETRVWTVADGNGMRAVPIPEEVKALLASDEALHHPLVRSA